MLHGSLPPSSPREVQRAHPHTSGFRLVLILKHAHKTRHARIDKQPVQKRQNTPTSCVFSQLTFPSVAVYKPAIFTAWLRELIFFGGTV